MYQRGNEAVPFSGKVFRSWEKATLHLTNYHAQDPEQYTLIEETEHVKIISLQAWNEDRIKDKNKAKRTYFLVDVTPIATGYVSTTSTFKTP